jgi:hypothetical protein
MNGSNAWRWRLFVVELLIGASAVVVALAAFVFAATADIRDLLILGATALVGIGLMVAPNTTDHGATPV